MQPHSSPTCSFLQELFDLTGEIALMTGSSQVAEDPEFDAWLKSRTPMDRGGDPREPVGAAVFLVAPASSFVSGQIHYIDGGVLAPL